MRSGFESRLKVAYDMGGKKWLFQIPWIDFDFDKILCIASFLK